MAQISSSHGRQTVGFGLFSQSGHPLGVKDAGRKLRDFAAFQPPVSSLFRLSDCRNAIFIGRLGSQYWTADLGLLFRILAQMRSIDRITQVANDIDEMNREEAGCWLGIAMHRKRRRRVLPALRMLLTET